MHFQGGTCSFRTGVTWPGLCQAWLHNYLWNTGLVFVPFCHCHYWQQGNAQRSCVWKHALLSHFVVYFCGYEFLETEPEFPIFCSPWGLRISHSSKQWPFCQILSCHFLPSCWICFTSTPCPHSVPGQQERAGHVSCLSHWTNAGGSCLRCRAVPGIFVAGCKCHPWSLGSACWLHPRRLLQRGEKHSSSGTACSCCTHGGDIFKLPLECFGWHCEWKELTGSHPFLQ